MSAIEVVSDANVVLKWFHSEGEEEVDQARALLHAHRAREIGLAVLDLTSYEIGNALLRGGAAASAEQVATVIEALSEICITVGPSIEDFRLATDLADRHGLTLYDATYAAVAQNQGAELATLDRQLLEAGLGTTPGDLVEQLRS
jgi:predicted nucleic acid-binding protein